MKTDEEPSDTFLYILLGIIAALAVVLLLWKGADAVVSWFADDEPTPTPTPYEYEDVNRSNSFKGY